ENFESAIRKINGQGSGISLTYFFMLAGEDNLIKPDRMIIQFLFDRTGKEFKPPECQEILTGIANELNNRGKNISPRLLDYSIWNYQRNQEIKTPFNKMKKKILYIDMDNVLVDFPAALTSQPTATLQAYKGNEDEIPHLFRQMLPMKDAIESFQKLSEKYDTYILSTAPWENPSAWSEKLEWVKKYLGKEAYKRLIISHHKELNRGDYLIDDRTKNGAGEFKRKLILFGSEAFPDWKTVCEYLL
ncbi:MAG: hypothetical protein LBT50_02290, partial [Prevotellaceae bacterium]|nr:hypothetical protein [Prevotellaceae bacterium]